MAQKSKLWYLENFNLFRGLKNEGMENLNKISSMQTVSKSQPIYFAKEPSRAIFFLKEGRVKLTRLSQDGKELIIAIVNPGEVFGELAMFDEGERTDYAYTIEESILCAISKNDFQKFIEKIPELNLRITKLVGLKLKKFSERIEDLVFKDAEHRVLSFVYSLAQEHGKRIGGELIIKPFLTHQDIAKLTACSRQTVNTVLTDAREKGLLYFDRKKAILKDPVSFKALASK
ncbi:MAG: Crp/Fnr family transcriptional regulator [Ignavibacteriales bacterium]|nr:MAG: Crp/Fnr family transcriptional regulator [Ignavibacteriales bacterium]